ncbi:MCE family protein [Mycolicibacterium sp. 018/SC-01/001]|uniref:MCE family protein n=1 Tax=Mycolicibacterium sp. 018/SC-01/001 TaxID=2592069 RepID=UPI00117DBEB6|nr:MlaD family protein [Mycolicibacterium sp. 018/SC-01/001]TRW76747.1 MCE family protein [Mycolicibacterium sp. 018/SC-01/001]
MLTRFVKVQLIIFSTVSVIAMTAMVFLYMQLPAQLGIGRYEVTLQMPDASGLYRYGNVTLRGVQIGEVTDVQLRPDGASATLSLDRSPRVPADLRAEIRSVSAVGEQYVDLLPRTDNGPYLSTGSVIPAANVTLPQPVGPMVDKLSALFGSIPKDRIGDLLDESSQAFGGAGFDMGSLIDSTRTVASSLDSVSDNVAALTTDSAPLIQSQVQTTDALRLWTRSLAGVTEQVAANDPEIRGLLDKGPGALQETARLLTDLKPTLPILLANLSSLTKVGVTYNASLRQLIVLLPPYLASLQSFALPTSSVTGFPQGDFVAAIGDPPACTVGFLPQSQWRSPADTSDIDTPDGLYCKLPQDSPLAVRGARNAPCIEVPGKRAATVEDCRSDRPFMPLAMRQPALGPNPLDPNLIAQGIPPDERVDTRNGLYGPVAGTPRPDGAGPSPTAPPPPPPAATPSAFTPPTGQSQMGASEYDITTGRYLGPDGQAFRQTDLDAKTPSWQNMIAGAGATG